MAAELTVAPTTSGEGAFADENGAMWARVVKFVAWLDGHDEAVLAAAVRALDWAAAVDAGLMSSLAKFAQAMP